MPTAPFLDAFDGNRRNNFTALRILFAWMVLFGHSFPVTGHGELNPLRDFFQRSTWIGEVAVGGFFIISGFLVTASFQRRGIRDYTVSRVLRIYPALALCVLLTVFLLGPLLTSLDAAAYLSSPGTWDYLRNITALFPMDYRLPGLFETLPRPGVNGSLWTLTVEVSCYILLGLAGVLGLLQSRGLANLVCLAVLAFGLHHFTSLPLVGRAPGWATPALHFLVGIAFYVNRAAIPVDGRLAVVAAALWYVALGEPWFHWVAAPAFAYLIFFLAYGTPHLDIDGRLGDPSYGIYIYAWPVQQTLVQLFPEEGPYFNAAVATVLVFALAMLSWRLLERPALGLKARVMRAPADYGTIGPIPGGFGALPDFRPREIRHDAALCSAPARPREGRDPDHDGLRALRGRGAACRPGQDGPDTHQGPDRSRKGRKFPRRRLRSARDDFPRSPRPVPEHAAVSVL